MSAEPGGESASETGAGRGEPTQPSEEELRARLEEELRKIQVGDVLLQTVVTLVNLAGQRLGLSEATRELRDPAQARLAIEAVRALLPLLESDEELGSSVAPIRDALSQLQLAYAREAGEESGVRTGTEEATHPGQQAPAREGPREQPSGPKPPGDRPGRSSGRLWTPPGSA